MTLEEVKSMIPLSDAIINNYVEHIRLTTWSIFHKCELQYLAGKITSEQVALELKAAYFPHDLAEALAKSLDDDKNIQIVKSNIESGIIDFSDYVNENEEE